MLVLAGTASNLEKLRQLVNSLLHGYELIINKNGIAQLISNNLEGPPSTEQAAVANALSAAINRSEVIRIGVESGASDVLGGNLFSGKIDIQDIAAVGRGPAVSSASMLSHELVEQTAGQVFDLMYSIEDVELAHLFGTAAQDFASGFTRGRTNDDLLNYKTGTGYTLTEQTRGNQRVIVVFKWVNGNLVKVIRR
jgi:hypothetical protein